MEGYAKRNLQIKRFNERYAQLIDVSGNVALHNGRATAPLQPARTSWLLPDDSGHPAGTLATLYPAGRLTFI